jgi:phosphatidylglycerophosphate synthase
MKPVVSAMQAWSWYVSPGVLPPLSSLIQANIPSFSTVISAFAILILGIIGLLFKAEHPELVGGDEDPEDGSQVAGTVFLAVLIYAVSEGPPGMSRC